MSIYGVDIEDNKTLDLFVKEMQHKLKSPDLFQNPFKGFIKKNKYPTPYLFVYFDLIWINPFYPALFLTMALTLAFKFTLHWTFLFLIPLWLGAFMFTKPFSQIALHCSLRKFGYKGKINFISDTELLKRLAKWGKAK